MGCCIPEGFLQDFAKEQMGNMVSAVKSELKEINPHEIAGSLGDELKNHLGVAPEPIPVELPKEG